MKTKNYAAILVSVFAVIFIFALSGFAQPGDSFKPIEKTHPGADLAAQNAVIQQSKKTKTDLKLVELVKAEGKEGPAGKGSSTFRDCIKVNDGKQSSFAQVVVSVDLYSNYKLLTWENSNCGGDGYSPVEKTHPGAGLAADFAVKEKSKTMKPGYVLVEVAKAEAKGGPDGKLGSSTFRGCLKVTLSGNLSFVQAVVTMDQYSNMKLISWEDSKCGQTADEYETVENTHAGIGLAADFAVKKHSEDTKIVHTVSEILKGEIKGTFSPTYRVCMKVAEDGKTHVIQAVVTMDQYSNMKLVSWEHSTCGQ